MQAIKPGDQFGVIEPKTLDPDLDVLSQLIRKKKLHCSLPKKVLQLDSVPSKEDAEKLKKEGVNVWYSLFDEDAVGSPAFIEVAETDANWKTFDPSKSVYAMPKGAFAMATYPDSGLHVYYYGHRVSQS